MKANRANVANADAKMDFGTLVWMSQSGHEFNLYGGILDASAITKGGDGTAIRINGGSTFNMYGGQIKGGTAASAGGAVYVNAGGVFNLYDGTVSGGNAADGGIFDVRGEVGNNNHGVLNVKGGTITGGKATNNGGNIRVLGGTLNIEGMPVYRDAIGGVGTPTSDNERTKLSLETTHLLTIINGYSGKEGLQEAADYMVELIKEFASAEDVELIAFE